VTATLPDGAKRVGQSDGGSGFSGKRSPEVHLGLGEPGEVDVEVRWRDPKGQLHTESLGKLKAGWHTVWLGWNDK
jgi:hypothetical protein